MCIRQMQMFLFGLLVNGVARSFLWLKSLLICYRNLTAVHVFRNVHHQTESSDLESSVAANLLYVNVAGEMIILLHEITLLNY